MVADWGHVCSLCARFLFCILRVVGITRCISLEFWVRFLGIICYCVGGGREGRGGRVCTLYFARSMI